MQSKILRNYTGTNLRFVILHNNYFYLQYFKSFSKYFILTHQSKKLTLSLGKLWQTHFI